ncbi:MAG: hypothetical protein KGK07_05080 [Chloroflexota bacterium]|nr:hypothetical protein [Chloroflexota bacterium]
MSSATNPYQPAGAELRITRSILEVFHEQPIGLLVVQTRSPFVEKDFDLPVDMPLVWLSMTVETDDDAVRHAPTPTCPAVDRRFKAMRRAARLRDQSAGSRQPDAAALGGAFRGDPRILCRSCDRGHVLRRWRERQAHALHCVSPAF